jgi:exodeoxyribonuclease V alpha subunit
MESSLSARNKRGVIKQLEEAGISRSLAERCYYRYGFDASAKIHEDPYLLLTLQERMTWQQVDPIALSMGITLDSPIRVQGAVRCALANALNDGHMFLPDNDLNRMVSRYISNDDEMETRRACEELTGKRDVAVSDIDGIQAVYLRRMFAAELTVAELLTQLYHSVSSMALVRPTKDEMGDVEESIGKTLAKEQYNAIQASLEHKMVIITGGPGTGKTTIIRGVIDLWNKKHARIKLLAPTGRAARRLSESTGEKASTIHRALEYDQNTQSFRRNARRPLKLDLLVVDEASMVDTELMATLLEALPPSCHILIVGDVDQLPSVGAGNVLHDLIESELFKTVRLTEIYRQTEGSLISVNAKRINEGELPELDGAGLEQGQDFFFIQKIKPNDMQDAVVEMVTERIPKQFGLDTKRDIQVLTPMLKRGVGVDLLNNELQQRLNPATTRFKAPFYTFNIGDKIMQTKNDYDKDVFNGDIGFVVSADQKKGVVTCDFEGRMVEYEWYELENTSLAYAMTVHKSQGSEYPAVVMPLDLQHGIMLQRNLLYTAVSRGKQLVVLIGNKNALEKAVRNNKIRTRYTGLKTLLQQSFAGMK